jgi:hypothetical protein
VLNFKPPVEIVSGTNWIRGWMDKMAGMNMKEKDKMLEIV